MKSEVSIIILTYNQLEYTVKCLDSIPSSTDIPFELILVDNASQDGTKDYLADYTQSMCSQGYNIKFIDSPKNLGFAGGVNKGIRASTAPFICLLNNDTVLTKGWLENLKYCLDGYPEIEIVGPYTDGMYPPQYVSSIECLPGGIQEVDTLYGYCMLFRRSLLLKIGALDEQYSVGCFEDVDFVERVLRIKGKIAVSGDTFIYHRHHASWKSELHIKIMLAKNVSRFKAKWGYGDNFDGGFKERPLFTCDLSKIVIVPSDVRKLEEYINSANGCRNKSDEWVFVDAYDDEEAKKLINQLRNSERVIHVQTCLGDIPSVDQLVNVGVNNIFGNRYEVEYL